MAWLAAIMLALASGFALWRFAQLDRPMLQLVGAGLCLALAGYAWQGRPDLEGKSPPPLGQQLRGTSAFAEMREPFLGSFDRASRWLIIAESYQRRGDTRSGVGIIKSGLRGSPRDSDLWIGLGHALLLHADGVMTPAVQFAFKRAAELAPAHPGPKFFYGLALAQSGQIDAAELVWRDLLSTTPPEASYRPLIEEKLAALLSLKSAAAARRPGPAAQ